MLHIRIKSPAWRIVLFVPMLLCSCSGDETNTDAPEDSINPIGFSASDRWNNDGSRLIEDTNNNTTSFSSGDAIGVFAYKNNSSTPDFMNNQSVIYNGTDTWTYTPTKYWPQNNGELSFYAYYPYDSENIKVISTTGTPSFKYDAKEAGTDVLAALSLGLNSSPNNGVVPLSFVHLLAKVKFTFTSSSSENHPVVHALKYDIPCEGTCKYTLPLKFDNVSNVKSTLLRFVRKSEGVVINTPNIAIDEFTAYILPCDISEFFVSINNVFVNYKPAQAVTVKAGYQYTVNFVISVGDDSSFFITSYSLWETEGTTYEGELK